MSLKPRDPLLAAARVVLIFLMSLLGFVTVLLAVLAPALAIMRGEVIAQLAEHNAPPEAAWAVVAALALGAVAAALGFLFFRNMYRIVDTVGEGDPFVPVNADRLSGMGWIVVAVHAVAIPLGAVVTWLASVTEGAKSDMSLSLGGLVMALVLFVLARVFREGARMRAELEGTV